MKIKIDLIDFNKKMNGLTDYAEGFLTTLASNENQVADAVAESAVESAYTYVDTMARMHPDRLHHVYEWGRPGDASARLYELKPTSIAKNVYEIKSNFLDSKMPTLNSGQVFAKKASIMESGTPLIIKPKRSSVLVFEVDGETIFTPNEVRIPNPGGNVEGAFADVIKDFQNYFESTFSRSTIGLKLKTIGKIFKPGSNPNRAAGKAAAIKFISGLKQL